ncbi:MAG: holo-ACP synthase [Candidatus Nitrosopumilus sp. bin_68KS]
MLEGIGIGIDIIDIKRFQEKPFDKNQKFYQKIFNVSEINYCLKKKNAAETFASKFAIKEAVIKSTKKQLDLLDILTDYVDSKPTVSLSDDSTFNFLVSISHEKSYAIAMVISEKK